MATAARCGSSGRLVWRIKLRLQFTGWLQFMPNAVGATLFLVLAGIAALAGGGPPWVWPPLTIAALFALNGGFEVATLKFGLRPPEAIPAPRDDLDAFDLMRARRACRSFQRRALTVAHRDAIVELACLNALPGHRIGTAPVRFEYVAAPLTVWPVLGAREFLVAIAPRAYDRQAVIDVGRSLQKVVLQATRMGVASCWIGPGADQNSVVAKLGDRFDPARDHVICVCALGYESWIKPLFIRLMQFSQHRRLPLSQLFFADPAFRTPLDVAAPAFADYGRCFEACQWAPSSYNGQPTRCAAVPGPDGAPLRFDFCAATQSRYYAAVALGIWCANWETGCAALGKSGHFAVLSAAERGVADPPDLPRYDISWIVARPDAATGGAGGTM